MKPIFALLTVVMLLSFASRNSAAGDAPFDIGSRRELFVDGRLLDSLRDARRQLHHPIPREVAIVHDAPWEGVGSGYHTVVHEGALYRMYYRGSALGVENGRLQLGREVYCYAESRDGITTGKVWKPEGFRAIRTATSRDFLKWEHEADFTYRNSPAEHLYTNQVAPYFRAPHLLIGCATRISSPYNSKCLNMRLRCANHSCRIVLPTKGFRCFV